MPSVVFFVLFFLFFELINFTSQIVITKMVTDFVFFGMQTERFKTVCLAVFTNSTAACEKSSMTAFVHRTCFEAVWPCTGIDFKPYATGYAATLTNLWTIIESTHTATNFWTSYQALWITSRWGFEGSTTCSFANVIFVYTGVTFCKSGAH